MCECVRECVFVCVCERCVYEGVCVSMRVCVSVGVYVSVFVCVCE